MILTTKTVWTAGGNSTEEEYDPLSTFPASTHELTDHPSSITRRRHAREQPEKARSSRRMRRTWLVFARSYTRRRGIMRRSRWRSRSRRTRSVTSSLRHQMSLPTRLSHNIFSTDRILRTRRLWAARVRRTHAGFWRACWPVLVKNKRKEKAAKFSVPLPKVRGIAEEEMFKVVKTGKKTNKKGSWIPYFSTRKQLLIGFQDGSVWSPSQHSSDQTSPDAR